MTRRGLLGLFVGAAAAATFDPERALWVPGRKLISIPKPACRIWAGSPGNASLLWSGPAASADLTWDAYVRRIDESGAYEYSLIWR